MLLVNEAVYLDLFDPRRVHQQLKRPLPSWYVPTSRRQELSPSLRQAGYGSVAERRTGARGKRAR